MHNVYVYANKVTRYRREDRSMPLYISIRIDFYNGIVLFLCHSTHFCVCLQTAVNYQSKSDKYTRKNQSDRIVDADK